MKKKTKAIFSDIDGTLCFHQEIHAIESTKRNSDGTFVVIDKKQQTFHQAYCLSPGKKIFLDVKTRELAHQLRKDYDFVFVSGARFSTIKSRLDFLDFADIFILENGGLILDSQHKINQEWSSYLEYERTSLVETRNHLLKDGWILDDIGRTSAIRINLRDNPHKTQTQVEILFNDFKLPNTLKKTSNMGNLDIILKSAGKANAVNFVSKLREYDLSQSISIGDDINDIELLLSTPQSFVLASSFPSILDLAQQNNWQISKKSYFDGINEILESIIHKTRK